MGKAFEASTVNAKKVKILRTIFTNISQHFPMNISQIRLYLLKNGFLERKLFPYRLSFAIISLFFLMSSWTVFGQSNNEKIVADSLRKLAKKEAQIDAYLYFAQNYFHDDLGYSLKLAQKALDLAQKINHEEGQIKAYLSLAGYVAYTQANQAYIYFQKAEEIAQNTSNTKLLVRVLEQKALYHVRWLQYAEAITCVQTAIKIVESQHLDLEIPYETMAIILSKQGNYQKAIVFYKIVIAHDQAKEEKNLSGVFSEMGNVYYRLQNYDSARWCYEEGLKIAKKYQQERDLGYLYGNIGLSFYKQQKHQQALVWQKKALECRQKSQLDLGIIAHLNNLGKTYLALNCYDSALLIARESFPKANQFKDLFFLQEVNEVMADAFFGLKMFDSAFLYQKNAYRYLDSLKQAQEKQAIKGAASIIEAQNEIADNQLLKKENQVLSIGGVFFLVLFLTILLASVLIFRQNQSKKKLLIQLQEANQIKDKMFAIIAHDLRSPISAFGIVARQLDYFLKKKDTQKLEAVIQNIAQTGKNLAHLLDNLLDWALSQKQEIGLDKQKIDLAKTFAHLYESYEEIARFSNIRLLVDLPENIKVFTDENMLKAILRNLLNNALKYTPTGGQIEIGAYKEHNEILLFVKDTGKGMSAEKVAQLFDKKLKKPEKGFRGEKGTGLGLLLVDEFVQFLHARIQIQSQEGQGSIFRIYLPK